MQSKRLGWTDLELSRIGLGTWAIGGGGWAHGWGPQDDRDSERVIREALDTGMNWIDTAAVYGLGHAETVIGNTLKQLGERPLIATKCGLVWTEKGKIRGRLKGESIRREVEDSLRRLQVDVIDLYQIHWPVPETDIEDAWETIAGLIQDGKIRYGGVSNFTVPMMERLLRIHPIASLQPQYNMFQRDIEAEILPFCAANDIGVLAYSPMFRGMLTGKMTADRIAALPVNDHRKYDAHFKPPLLDVNLHTVNWFRELSVVAGKPFPQLAVAWVLRNPAVTAAITGARRPGQIREIAPAAGWKIADALAVEIEQLLQERLAALSGIPETGEETGGHHA